VLHGAANFAACAVQVLLQAGDVGPQADLKVSNDHGFPNKKTASWAVCSEMKKPELTGCTTFYFLANNLPMDRPKFSAPLGLTGICART
jgi:hypothetical protein